MIGLPPAPPVPRLWTAWCHYGATGEGETLLALIAYAESAEEMRTEFGKVFDPYFECTAAPGVVRNLVTTCLFSENTLEYVQSLDRIANVVLHGQLHFNFS